MRYSVLTGGPGARHKKVLPASGVSRMASQMAGDVYERAVRQAKNGNKLQMVKVKMNRRSFAFFAAAILGKR
jgi:hypothetical protein